jgi:hypothetical protein
MRALGIILLLALNSGSFALDAAPRDGFWEASDGRGGAVGIYISSVGHPYVTLGIYQRKGPEIQCLEENFFTTDPKYLDSHYQDVTTYDGSLVGLHFKPRSPQDLTFDIELTRDPSTNTWSGDFHRGSFQQHVLLERVDRRSNNGGCFIEGPLPSGVVTIRKTN